MQKETIYKKAYITKYIHKNLYLKRKMNYIMQNCIQISHILAENENTNMWALLCRVFYILTKF